MNTALTIAFISASNCRTTHRVLDGVGFAPPDAELAFGGLPPRTLGNSNHIDVQCACHLAALQQGHGDGARWHLRRITDRSIVGSCLASAALGWNAFRFNALMRAYGLCGAPPNRRAWAHNRQVRV